MSLVLLGILNSQASGGAAGDYELIETTILSGSASNVTFSNLSNYSDYKHLQIRASMQGLQDGNLEVRFNGDTGTNYAFHRLKNSGTSVISAGGGGYSLIELDTAVADDITANNFSPAVIDILDAFSTTKNTTVRWFTGQVSPDSNLIAFGSGLWRNTAALSSIYLGYQGGSAGLKANTRFSLYGIRG